MKIIIAGAGKIGYSVAEILASEGHDITVIDINSNTINNLSNNLDVICVEGSATNSETLLEAGAAEADLLVASTRSDESNMVIGISARKLGTKHVIARIRDTAYLRQTEFLREALGLSVIVNPEYECAKEISRILRFPSAIRVDAFSKGSVEIVEHRVSEGGKLDGTKLKNLGQIFPAKVLVGVVERDGEAIIPNGDFTLKGGDLLSITGSDKELRKFFISTGQYKKPVRRVMIMGGGRIAVYLTHILLGSGIEVSVVESDRARCEELCELIPEARIIHGDATSSEVLLEEGILSTDAFVALTGDDGDNIITSMYAKHMDVGKIVVKVNREYYDQILDSAGLDTVVAPKTLISQQLARYVRAMDNSLGSSMETLHKLADGKVEALEFKVDDSSRTVGVPLKQLKLKKNILLSAIVRGNKTILPGGDTEILPGDHAVVVTKAGWLKVLDDILD
jgi:trk system potassium uptake protein TrkA